jgi:hypothetical protein
VKQQMGGSRGTKHDDNQTTRQEGSEVTQGKKTMR